MRVLSAVAGDAMHRRLIDVAGRVGFVVDPVDVAEHTGSLCFFCLSCGIVAANAYNLIEHCALAPRQSHVIARKCASCEAAHSIDSRSARRIVDAIGLWPMGSDVEWFEPLAAAGQTDSSPQRAVSSPVDRAEPLFDRRAPATGSESSQDRAGGSISPE